MRCQRRFLDLQGFLRIDHGRLGAGLRGLQGRAHGHPLLQSRDQGLLRGNRLGQALLLGLFLRELRFEALDANRQLAEIAQQNELLAGAFGGRNVLRPIDAGPRVDGLLLNRGQGGDPAQPFGAVALQGRQRIRIVGARFGGVEFDENLARADMLAVFDMDGHHLAAVDGLDGLHAAGGLDLALRHRDDVDAAEIAPGNDKGEQAADRPDEPDLHRRRRGFQDRKRRGQELAVGARLSHSAASRSV